MSLLVDFVVAVAAAVVAEEALGWLDRCSRGLVRFYAHQLPVALRDRYEEEWLGVLDELPGKLSRFAFAVDLLRASRSLSREYKEPQQTDKETLPSFVEQIGIPDSRPNDPLWNWIGEEDEEEDESWWVGPPQDDPTRPTIINATPGTFRLEGHAPVIIVAKIVEGSDSTSSNGSVT